VFPGNRQQRTPPENCSAHFGSRGSWVQIPPPRLAKALLIGSSYPVGLWVEGQDVPPPCSPDAGGAVISAGVLWIRSQPCRPHEPKSRVVSDHHTLGADLVGDEHRDRVGARAAPAMVAADGEQLGPPADRLRRFRDVSSVLGHEAKGVVEGEFDVFGKAFSPGRADPIQMVG